MLTKDMKEQTKNLELSYQLHSLHRVVSNITTFLYKIKLHLGENKYKK